MSIIPSEGLTPLQPDNKAASAKAIDDMLADFEDSDEVVAEFDFRLLEVVQAKTATMAMDVIAAAQSLQQ